MQPKGERPRSKTIFYPDCLSAILGGRKIVTCNFK